MRNSIDVLSTLLLALLILATVNPWYSHYLMIEGVLVFILVTAGAIYFSRKNTFISKKLFLLVSLFSIVFFLQASAFGLFPWFTIVGFFVRLLCAYFIVNICKDFPLAFVRVVVVLSSISLVIWFLEVFTPLGVLVEAFPKEYVNEKSIVPRYISPFYTSLIENLDSSIKRNAGFSWEPAAFAGINLMAMMFCQFRTGNFRINKRKRYLTVFIMSVLSSQSTTAFVAFPIVLYLVFRQNASQNKVSFRGTGKSLLFVFFILLPICVYFFNLPFVSEKIEQQLQVILIDSTASGLNNTRFGSMVFDLFYFYESPIIGNGLNEITRFRFHGIHERALGHGNGLTDFLADFGIIVFIVVVWFIYRGIASYSPEGNVFPLLATLVLFLLLFSEAYFNHPFFWCYVFLSSDTKRLQNMIATPSKKIMIQ
jgi:hypothetical protein